MRSNELRVNPKTNSEQTQRTLNMTNLSTYSRIKAMLGIYRRILTLIG